MLARVEQNPPFPFWRLETVESGFQRQEHEVTLLNLSLHTNLS